MIKMLIFYQSNLLSFDIYVLQIIEKRKKMKIYKEIFK